MPANPDAPAASPRFPLRRAGLVLAGFFLVAACALLAFCPHIDLAAARLFYSGGHFIGDTATGRFVREMGRAIPFLLLGGLTLLWAGAKARIIPDLGLRGRGIAWLLLSMALGPGLVVDGLKEISHRPRPVHVTQFGGAQNFRPFYRFDGACPRNCSFPSGEASAAFWTLAPASLAPLPIRTAAIATALVFAIVISGLRMAFGGHFLSDVLFAGLFTVTILWGLRHLIGWEAVKSKFRESGKGPESEN